MIHLTPAECVIRAFGGVRKTAKGLSRMPGAVIYWKRRGLVPNAVQVVVLSLANKGIIKITADELIKGKDIKNRG